MNVDLLIHSAAQLLTLAGGPQRGAELGRLGIIEDGALAVRAGKIVAVGASSEVTSQFRADRELDATGKVVMPGFVDPHTHLIWVGDRADEFEMRIGGASYMEVMNAGGGIMSTVRKTREAGVDQLVEEAMPRIRRMLRHGTTTVEAKSGYGLETAAELRQLEAIQRLGLADVVDIVPTFLGAHALPTDYQDKGNAYVEVIVKEMLPEVKEQAGDSPPFVDVFCEDGAFTLEQSRTILEHASEMGFPLKIHADEFVSLGGAGLAAELGAHSADHLVVTPKEEMQVLGRSNTVAVGLPCTPFGLGQGKYTPARDFLRANAILAIATDLNPGTGWCESMQFVIALACRYMKLSPAQAIAAATINAAAAIGRADGAGSLEEGKQADVLILDAPDYRHLGYRFGTNLVQTVIRHGRVVVEREV